MNVLYCFRLKENESRPAPKIIKLSLQEATFSFQVKTLNRKEVKCSLNVMLVIFLVCSSVRLWGALPFLWA